MARRKKSAGISARAFMAGFSSAGRELPLPTDAVAGLLSSAAASLRSLGHTPLRQGRSFECSTCGLTGTALLENRADCGPVIASMTGTIATRRCES